MKLRASQNQWLRILHRQARQGRAPARRNGRRERLDLLPASARIAEIYTARERAALDWVEALTRLTETGAPDHSFEALKPHFTEKEIVNPTVLVGHINLLNRLPAWVSGCCIRSPIMAEAAAARTPLVLRHAEGRADLAACFP